MPVSNIIFPDGKAVPVSASADAAWAMMSDLLELPGRGAIRPTPVSKRAPLNYRPPHTNRHHAFGMW